MATNPSTLPENVGRLTAPDANYPYGSAKNDSTGTTGDGTPIRAPLMNDTYGFYQALLTRAGIVPSGVAETALNSQLADAIEALIAAAASDTLNTVRVDVPAAISVDLTALAPDTRHVRLTGAATINDFVVAEGRFYFVTVGGSQAVVNSADIVTQNGADIAALAGDTYCIGATADDVVYVWGLTRANPLAGVQLTYKALLPASPITLGGLLTIPHGLPATPDEINLRILNVTTQYNWVPGDDPFIWTMGAADGGGLSSGAAVWADATNVYIRFSTSGFYVNNKTTGAIALITAANWNIIGNAKVTV